ncbi:hypothetical protein DFP74_4985 [Nocardiopsis sp. Huas11]|uniref:DUF6297 family protein n=1 Tax=Nocardiopsis sp. Huas11 TaxID=2183912 RepID=UPI000EB55737|nr:DUF6297 family protein [Nocardiopsis sp. Huas11]RKS09252.1 hypothetical protein DFP74_4985 [Nocardiopsis sp. Huas11]
MTGVASVRAFTRARNRRHHSWSDRYVMLMALGLLATLVFPMIGRAVAAVPRDVDPARTGTGLALIALLLVVALSLARAVGPAGVSAADASWLVLSPLPRRDVLAPALLVLAGVSAAVGACLGLALLNAVGAPDALPLRLFVSVVLGVAWTLGGAAVTVLAQASPAWNDRLSALLVVLVVAAVALAVMSLGPGQGALAGLASAPPAAWAAVASASAAAAAGLAWRAGVCAARIPARAVLEASTRTGLASGAFVLMDPGTLASIAEDAHWRSRALRSRAWPRRLRGAAAVAWLDWRRLARRPGRLAAMAAATVLPVLAARAGGGMPAALLVLAVGAAAVAATGTAGARRDAGDGSLARLLGAGPRTLLAARAVLPALLGGSWLTLALAGLDLAGPGGLLWLLGPLCAPALAAGALRAARRRPVDHTLPVMDSPLGPVPTGPLLWALAGADLAVLGCLPALLAFTTGVSVPLLAAQAVCAAAVLAAYCAAPRRPST